MIEELRAQINAAKDRLARAEQAGLLHEVDLHRARLADLMEIAGRHGIDLAAPDGPSGGAGTRRNPDDPESGTDTDTELPARTTSPRTS